MDKPIGLQILQKIHSIEITHWQLAHYTKRGKFKGESEAKHQSFLESLRKLLEQRIQELHDLEELALNEELGKENSHE